MRWVFTKTNPETARQLSQALNASPLLARLLIARGLADADRALRFLSPRLDHLHDPFSMEDMARAVERLRRAIALNEKILIYGDYDVDGTMATLVLLKALEALGARVEVHVPNRFTDGYGMRVPVVERAAAEGVRVIVSVDTGIREHTALRRMKDLGVDGIVTDHHLPEGCLPEAHAILNPRRADCAYPEKNLSGAGVAFKLAQALLGETLSEAALASYLKVVAIGTIADVVPLTGENRVIAHYGLAGLTESAQAPPAAAPGRAGISALIDVAGLRGKRVSAGDVAFRLAPRLNAAGRMESARAAIDLFTRAAGDGALDIAARLDELNRGRQRAEDEIVGEILAQMNARADSPGSEGRFTLVFAGAGWHRGVIGIAAQRVVDLFHRPALVLSIEGEMAHGSGRSIAGFHLIDALSRSAHLFERFGGHAQAAGFTLKASHIQRLEEEFEQHARSALTPADLEPELRIDSPVRVCELDRELFGAIQTLEPFGCGNPCPVFAAEAERISPPRILKEKHLKFWVADPNDPRKRHEAIGWGMARCAEALERRKRIALAFSLAENSFDGLTSLHLILKDVKPVY